MLRCEIFFFKADPVLSSVVVEITTVLSSTVTEIVTVAADGKAFFSPRHLCDALGIAWQGQHEKIKNDEVLSSVVKLIVTTAADGKNYKTTMLPIEFLSGWLFTIKKVRPEVQQKLNMFRAEAFHVLDLWFRQTNPDSRTKCYT